MAFRFRLEKVLTFRQRIVDQKSREVGEAGRIVAAIQSRVAAVRQKMTGLMGSAHQTSFDVHFMARRRTWLDHLARQLVGLEGEVAAAEMELENRRAELTEAWRDLEVLKKLKERQKTLWFEEQLRRENHDLDEIGQIRADRQRREKLASVLEQPAG